MGVGSGSRMSLTCEQTRLVLQRLPSTKPSREYTVWELAALEHYTAWEGCLSCRTEGLAQLAGCSFSCEQALEICRELSGPVYLAVGDPVTLAVLVAVEHVCGRTLMRRGRPYHDYAYGQCENAACRAICNQWSSAPLGELERDCLAPAKGLKRGRR
ncbi:MAG: hypothetical protein U1A16_04955 [Patescibacteria group bacterium]|nr:hypothetical protein [Patescibacteria group bacterium]